MSQARWMQYIPYPVAKKLYETLPTIVGGHSILPNGSEVMIYAYKIVSLLPNHDKPQPCKIDLGGDIPLTLFKNPIQ